MIDMVATGLRIKELIMSRYSSCSHFAKYFGLSSVAVCAWTRGEKLPNIDNLVSMADLFNVKIDDIIVRIYTGKEQLNEQ